MDDQKIMVVKQITFDSAHYLPDYNGPCKNMHGHTYKLEVGFEGLVDTKTGMLIDFNDVKTQLNYIKNQLDHTILNGVTTDDFPAHMPTAENMVNWIKVTLQNKYIKNVELSFVRLWETPTSYAEWRK